MEASSNHPARRRSLLQFSDHRWSRLRFVPQSFAKAARDMLGRASSQLRQLLLRLEPRGALAWGSDDLVEGNGHKENSIISSEIAIARPRDYPDSRKVLYRS